MTLISETDRVAADLVRRYSLAAGDLVIEVGSGEGKLLRAIRALGPRVLGIESDPRKLSRAFRAGVDTIAAHFTTATALYLRPRYGAARLVIAHAIPTDGIPLDLVRGAALCMEPAGVLAFVGQSVFAEIRPNPETLPRAA